MHLTQLRLKIEFFTEKYSNIFSTVFHSIEMFKENELVWMFENGLDVFQSKTSITFDIFHSIEFDVPMDTKKKDYLLLFLLHVCKHFMDIDIKCSKLDSMLKQMFFN